MTKGVLSHNFAFRNLTIKVQVYETSLRFGSPNDNA